MAEETKCGIAAGRFLASRSTRRPDIFGPDQQATKKRGWSSLKPIEAHRVASTPVYWGA